LLEHKADIEACFPGCTIVGDQHFAWAVTRFKKCRIVAPISAQEGELKECPSLRNPNRKKRVLNELDLAWNEAVRRIRARVETPGASCKRIFRSLANKFRGTEEEHDCVIRTALAFHNLRLRH
jgi:hypothetical protein